MEKKTIGTFISALRRAAGLTQRDLAEQLNVSDKAVSRWERDESAPDLTLLPLIADLFGITVDELLRGQRQAPTEYATPAPDGASDSFSDHDASAASSSVAPPLTPPGSKRQKMLFGNRLRKQKNLNYISIGQVAAGVVAALLCNYAFTRAALGFFLGLLFEIGAVVCALAFASATMPVSEEDYDASLLQNYKKSVIRAAYFPIYLATLTVPMLIALLLTWVNYGAFVGIYSGFLLVALVTLLFALLLHEVCTFVVLPLLYRRVGVEETQRESERRAKIGRLAKHCALVAVIGMIVPLVALGIFSNNTTPRTSFAKGTTFESYQDFLDYMATPGESGTTDNWRESDFETSMPYYSSSFKYDYIGDLIEIVAPGEKTEQNSNLQHLVIYGYDQDEKQVLAEFDWINADVSYISWSFDQNEDGTPITVYSLDEVANSYGVYDLICSLLVITAIAIPMASLIVYLVKRRTLS